MVFRTRALRNAALVAAIVVNFGAPASSREHGPVVAIDIGHTLARPGAISARGATEFSFNRRLALRIQAALERASIGTMLINADGLTEVLTDRTQKATGAGLFLSVHHDSVQPQFLVEWEFEGAKQLRSQGFRGFSLFISRSGSAHERSLACATTLGRFLREAGFKPSHYHAADIPGEGRPFADQENGVHYFDTLVVLKTAATPAVLFEAGVIVDPDEEIELSRAEVQEAIAEAVARGARHCLVEQDASRGGAQ
jgi:N-acetylmuramoyl-L-alanine amidase